MNDQELRMITVLELSQIIYHFPQQSFSFIIFRGFFSSLKKQKLFKIYFCWAGYNSHANASRLKWLIEVISKIIIELQVECQSNFLNKVAMIRKRTEKYINLA